MTPEKPAEAPRTPEEWAAEIVQEDGGSDYYHEGWAREDTIAAAITVALAARDATWREALRVADHGCREFEANVLLWDADRPGDTYAHACDACAPLRALLSTTQEPG